MDKILVPVDFSSASTWGFYYAYNLAKTLGADLHVLHLYWPPYVESSYPMDMIQTIVNEKEQEVLRHLKAATRPPVNAPENEKVNITYIVQPGSENSITSIAKEKEIDLIIMGTHGAGKALDKLWGSNTSNVIQNAPCPVMAIPEGAVFNGISNIAYATDFDEKDTEFLFELTLVATAIKAKLHCVHVNKADHPYPTTTEEAFQKVFKENFADLPVTYSVISALDVEEGLETFCAINNVDVLAMLTHDKTMWDKFFKGKSMTQSMTMRSKLPLLAFHK